MDDKRKIANNVLALAKARHERLSDLILCLTIFDVRRIIEDAIEETERYLTQDKTSKDDEK